MTKLTLVGLAAAASLLAQGPGFPGRPGGPGPGGPGGPMGGPPHTVTGAPYSGVQVTTIHQNLANGNTIESQTRTNVSRDGQGRVRTESAIHRPGAATTTGTASTQVTITDPVAGVMRHIDHENRSVNESPMHQAGRPGGPPNGGPNGGPGAGRRGPPPNQGDRAARPAGPAGRPGQQNDPNVLTEDLGTQTINGVIATGKRITHSIPAGAIGNTMPIQTVREVWMSTELKEPVLIKESDPRFGTTVTELTNVVRAEPDPTLFAAPAGYTVHQGGGPGGPGRGRGGAPR